MINTVYPYKIPWILNGNNRVLPSDDGTFYVSYNADTGTDIRAFAGDGSGEETALCKDGKYFILNGDHRKQYEELIDKGFEACKQYFKTHPDLVSSWSDEA